jgi:hypothetical protein
MSVVSPLALSTALLATLSWVGFIVSGFVLWSNGNTDGGYSMVGIAIILPAVVAALAHAVRAWRSHSLTDAHRDSLLWLSSLSWLGFIVCGFVLWSFGNTNGGYSMVGIATSLPFVVASLLLFLNYYHPLYLTAKQLAYAAPPLLTMSWAGFIVAGFMLWYYGNLSGGYAMVGIAICLPAVVAAVLLVHTLCSRKGFSSDVVSALSWLGSLSWSGFLVAGFMLWYFGNTNGGYSMVGIAIILPAVVALALTFVGACGAKAVADAPAASVSVAAVAAPAPAPAPAPVAPAAVVVDSNVTV